MKQWILTSFAVGLVTCGFILATEAKEPNQLVLQQSILQQPNQRMLDPVRKPKQPVQVLKQKKSGQKFQKPAYQVDPGFHPSGSSMQMLKIKKGKIKVQGPAGQKKFNPPQNKKKFNPPQNKKQFNPPQNKKQFNPPHKKKPNNKPNPGPIKKKKKGGKAGKSGHHGGLSIHGHLNFPNGIDPGFHPGHHPNPAWGRPSFGGGGFARPTIHHPRRHYYWGDYYPRVIPTIVIVASVPQTRTVRVTELPGSDAQSEAMINPNLFDARILLQGELHLPITDAKPVAASSDEELVVLSNPSPNLDTVYYRIGGNEYKAKPGDKQSLGKRQWWFINLDRGARYGRKNFSLTPGLYHFVPTANGWELQRQTVTVVLTNRQNVQPFHLLVNGRLISIAPGETVEFQHDRPIELIYSQDSLDTVKRALLSGNIYEVGIDARTGKWDLFRVLEEEEAAPEPGSSAPEPPAPEEPAGP